MDLILRKLSTCGLVVAALFASACKEDAATEPTADASTGSNVIGAGAVGDAGGGLFNGGGALPNVPGIPASSGNAAASDAATAGDSSLPAGGGDSGSGAVVEAPRLPSAPDLKQRGPFTPATMAGPSGYVLFYPKELGQNGVKHPIVSWGPGAAENAGMFTTLLNHLASHGFAVISFDGTPQGAELTKAIDWMVAENGRADSAFYQKLDTGKIAAGGHSAGSLATFVIAADPRLTTTLHISGGTFDPHTDIKNLHAPALFICGEPAVDGLLVGDVARANCDLDFKNATVPVFYGVTKGASHMTPTEIGDATLRSHQMAAITGWLRWQLARESPLKAMFAGSSCTLCADPNWTVQQKTLN